MGKICGFALLFLMLPGLTKAADPEIQNYQLIATSAQIPNCPTEAVALGQRFHEATGLDVVSAACSNLDLGSMKLTVSYLAAKKVEPHSAVFGALPTGGLGDLQVYEGFFSDLTQCIQAVPNLAKEYGVETGLTSVAAYCQGAFIGGFALRIDGFGLPKRPFYNSNYALDLPAPASKELVASVEALLTKAGASSVRFQPLGNYLVAMYYGPEGIPLFAHFISHTGWLATKAQCEEQRAEADGFFRTLGGYAVTSSCLEDAGSRASAIAFVFVGKTPEKTYWVKDGPVYTDYQSCNLDRERVRQLFSAQLKINAQAGLCTRSANSTSYLMILLGK